MRTVCRQIQGGGYEEGGAASRLVKEQLKKIGADPAVVRRAMIAAYEAEMNVVIHSHGGELRAWLEDDCLHVEVTDTGPGIPDIDRAMSPGYSTASAKARELGFGAGMGLPNIRKNADEFAIESKVGQGTRLSFAIHLKPQALYGAGRNSIRIAAEECRQSLRCVHACPTQAVRVFRGKPDILDYLCIDCSACIAVCPSGTLHVTGTAAELKPGADTVLVVPPAALVQFGPGVPAERVLRETAALGVGEVHVTAAWDAALQRAVVEYAAGEAPSRPVISPVCPAVVNLVETRFPSLISHLAPFVAGFEAAHRVLSGRGAQVFVALCPCQRTALTGADSAAPEVILPATFSAAIFPRLKSSAGARTGPATAAAGDESRPGEATDPRAARSEVLRVAGLRHVLNVLEAIENGLAGDLAVIELYACDEGCFGPPLLASDPHLALWRWEAAPPPPDPEARAVRRAAAFAPRRGLRLDEDMRKAIQKLARIDKLQRSLPGSDCGICGAPSCAALAEDTVLGRVAADACPRQRATGEEDSK